ncbi:F-box protein SKIP14 [Musa acuminata AAA Group]|uniref:(wild Malaysian banana) hypothetical protein n=1 Tax=Musa acuminata subsp. malaccensis TaxID=214687 RepID=A0A804I5V4_MUSAM|nr:PREDICTED: F-box protein SKIP14-like [Musa acuminata subsp. malaccensis]CAG1862869.1 unnamed protein product [Musa acuminata subsp. malaccensis]
MALNFSSCSVFSTPFVHTDDESSRSRCERSPLVSYWDTGSDYGYVEGDSGSTDVEGAFDPVDLLPDDPFGMGLDDSMGVAIASLLEVSGSDFFGWTLLYSPETQFYHDGWMEECDGWDDGDFTGLSVREAGDEILESGLDMGHSLNCNRAEEARSIIDDGTPHEGLLFSLGYLGVRDLLSVEGVCRSLRFAVQSDTLLWRCIHIDSPLSEKITDDVLLRLTQRAQGNLQCLSLTGCSRITDDGLKRVLDNNPRLRKLSVPGCVRLSLDGIINSLKVLQSQGMPGIEHLKLGRLFIVSEEQYGELKLLLGAEQLQQAKHQKPRFYHTDRSSPTCDDDCIIDIELCPLCQKYKLVYDCPSESCRGKGSKQCRACDVCIARCIQCGKCIKDCRYVETFCLEYLCSGCWKLPLVVHESNEEK